MQSSNVKNTKKNLKDDVKRPKSATRCPRTIPTYVVAFNVQDTYDDLATSKQITCPIRNADSSTNSVLPTNSLVISQTSLANPVTETSIRIFEMYDEVKSENSDDNQYGDVEKDSPGISDYFVVDNKQEGDSTQPEVIFNASAYNKRTKSRYGRFLRKKQSYKRVVKLRRVHFKYKNPNNNIATRLERIYGKTKRNSSNFCQIQRGLYANSITKVVSRSRLLKRGLAKENLLEDSDGVSFLDLYGHGNDNESLPSSQSTAKKSFSSCCSDKTLTRIESTSSSKIDDMCRIHPINSVIQMPTENVKPYKTNIYNVAIAVAYKTSKPNANIETVIISNQEKNLIDETLTSTDTIPIDNLTSNPSSIENSLNNNIIDILASDTSNQTLIGSDRKSSLDMSSDDTFFIAKTSSDFDRSIFISNDTRINSSETVVDMHATTFIHDYGKDTAFNNKPTSTLLNTVINLEMFSEITPTTSSVGTLENDYNDVLVTGNLIKNIPLGTYISDCDHEVEQREFPKNILKKVLHIDENYNLQKNFNLPNETTIQSRIEQNEQTRKKSCADESRNNYPPSIHEMWEKLVSVVDSAVKRLEDTLADKILTEIKKLLALFELKQLALPVKEESLNKDKQNTATNEDAASVPEEKIGECVQCDLVKNKVIDQLMLKLSIERPEVSIPRRSIESVHGKEKHILKDYIEVIKPPVVESSFEETLGKGDTVTVSTTTANVANEVFHRFSRLKLLLSAPLNFIRENMFVITSVPTFFVVLLCIYGFILFFMNPW